MQHILSLLKPCTNKIDECTNNIENNNNKKKNRISMAVSTDEKYEWRDTYRGGMHIEGKHVNL